MVKKDIIIYDGVCKMCNAFFRWVHKNDKKDVLGLDLEGKVFDCGDKLGYLKAIVEFAKNNKSIGKNFSSFLNSLIKKNK